MKYPFEKKDLAKRVFFIALFLLKSTFYRFMAKLLFIGSWLNLQKLKDWVLNWR